MMVRMMMQNMLFSFNWDAILDAQNHGLNWCTLVLGLLVTIIFFTYYYKKNHSRILLSYISNVWTSLGILGTFISIVYALGKMDWSTISLGDIGTLVGRIVPAFETSIIGIAGAVITSIIVKFIYAKEDKTYEMHNKEKIGDELTPEQTLHLLLTNIKKTNTTLNGISKKIAEGVLDEVHKVLSEKLVSIAEMHSTELAKTFNLENETLTNLTNLLIASIEQASHSTSEALQQYQLSNLSKIDEIGSQSISRLEELSSQFVSSIDEVKTNTVSAIERSMETQEKSLISNINKTTDSLVAKVNGLHTDFIKELSNNTKETLTILNEILHQLQTSAGEEVDKIETAMRTIVQDSANGLQAGIESNINALEKLTASLSRTLPPLVSVIESSYKEYDKTFKSAERILKRLEVAETQLADVLSNFDRKSTDIQEIYDKLEKISEFNRTLNYRLNECHRAFESAGKPLPTKCPYCGAEVENPMTRFCGKCGHDLFEEQLEEI